jgi:S-(hydroxymethyl)glutathione dehydrogenase / alcohol dehydrogenase
MRAAVYEGENRLVVDDVELRDPGPGEIVVAVAACGVCHSDLSAMDGTFPVPTPIVLGHEAAGVVEAVGPGVDRVAEGDRVVVTPAPPCGRCYGCVRGEPGTCVSTRTFSTFAHADGTTGLRRGGEAVFRGLGVAGFAERIITEHTGAVVVDEDVPLDIACLIGCGVQTGVGAVLNTARVEEGASVLVIGLGGVGLSVVQGARVAGASRILAVDPVAERRMLALELGATHVCDPAPSEAGADVVAAAHELTGGIGVDHAFEVVGRSALVRTGIDATRAGGTTVMVGAPALDDPLVIEAPVLFGAAEKRLVGCFLGSSHALRDIPRYLDLWRAGLLDLEALVTGRRPLDEIGEAMADLKDQRGVRTVITFGS